MSLTEIAKVNDVALAQILRGRLLSEGISAVLFDANLSGLLGGGFPGIRLMVPHDDAGLARQILDLPENKADN